MNDNHAPFTYDEPERSRALAASHWCDVVGSTLWCEAVDCPHGCTDGGDGLVAALEATDADAEGGADE